MDRTGYIILCYVLAISLLLGFAAFALYLAWRNNRQKEGTTEEFLTARSSAGMFRIAWSFYASAVGAWVFTGPPSYASYAGYIGLIAYAVSAGLPIIMIALLGDVIQQRLPKVVSMSDYVGWRFGVIPQTYVVLLTSLNMGIAMLAEYTTIGTLFSTYVGSIAYPIIIVVGVTTMIYTAFGGLYVSIITDQAQGIASVSFLAILAIYVAVTFRYPLANPLPANLAPNSYGFSALVSMPISMSTATVFSEAMWQRVWASDNPKSLKIASFLGAVGVIIAVGMAGFAGFLAWWAGIVDENTNANLYLFAVLQKPTGADPMVSSAIGVLALLLAVTMNESAVDSLQNGLVASLGGHFLKGKPLLWTRLLVVVLNVPIVILGGFGLTVLDLFLLTNMICSTSALPLVSPLLLPSKAARHISGECMVLACLMAAITVSGYGIGTQWDGSKSTSANFGDGLRYTWIGNGYKWEYLVIPLLSSFAYVLALTALRYWFLKTTGRQGYLPGFVPKSLAEGGHDGHSDESRDISTRGLQKLAIDDDELHKDGHKGDSLAAASSSKRGDDDLEHIDLGADAERSRNSWGKRRGSSIEVVPLRNAYEKVHI